jgi:hypothetical protein
MPKLRDGFFYGDSKHRTLWFVVSDDGEQELTGPMTEKDARAFLGLLDAVARAEDAMSVHMAAGCKDAFHDTLRAVRTAYTAVMEK